MNDYDLTHIKLSEDNRISQYSAQGFKKGLELARKISKARPDIIPTNDCNPGVRYSSKKIWKCVGTILNYCPAHIWHVSVSPDGQTLAVLSDDENGIDIWDTKSQTLIKKIICDVDFGSRFEITPDSKNIIIVESDRISTRSLEIGVLLSSVEYDVEYENTDADYLQSLNEKISNQSIMMNSELFDSSSVAISPGLNLIASHYENIIAIWNLKTGKLLHTLESKIDGDRNTLCLSYDSPILIVSDEYNSSHFETWNPINGKLIEENLDEDNDYGYGGAAISYDGLFLMKDCQIYNLISNEKIKDFNNELSFFDDNELHSIDDNEFHLVDTKIINAHSVDLFDYHTSSSFSKDGETIIIAGGSGAIMILKYLSIDDILITEPEDSESRIELVCKLIMLANKQYKLCNHKEAIESYTIALKIDPSNSEAYNRRSTARSAIGDYQGAMEDLQRVSMN